MLALGEYRRRLDPAGHYLPDTTAEDAEDAYVASEPIRCHACKAVSMASAPYRDDPHPESLLFLPERR